MLCSLPEDLLFSIQKQAMLLQIEAIGPSIYEDMPDLIDGSDRTVTLELPLGCYERAREAVSFIYHLE